MEARDERTDCPQVFWDSSEAIMAPPRSGRDACQWPLFVSLAAYTGAPALVAHACGAFASQMESMADQAIIASAMAMLQSMYASAPQDPQYFSISRWGSDAYSLGSDSFYAVGSTPSDRATLAEPVSGSLLFAGEATSVSYPATVHGAYLSGVDAAQRCAAAKPPPQPPQPSHGHSWRRLSPACLCRVVDSLMLPADCTVGLIQTTCGSGGAGTQGPCADACWAEVPEALAGDSW